MNGHEILIMELEHVLNKAKAFEFHDFKSSEYATPKMALNAALEVLIEHNQQGKYDN